MAKTKNLIQMCDQEILDPDEYKSSEMNANGDQVGSKRWFLPSAHFYHLCQDARVIKDHSMAQKHGKEK